MAADRRVYAYCVIEETEPRTFDVAGVEVGDDQAHTLHFQDLAAVVGRPPSAVHALSRAAAIAHEKVIEEVMRQYAVLPMSFGVVARSPAELRTKLLRDQYGELKEALQRIRGKVELDLKAYWKDMGTIFGEIAREVGIDPVKRTSAAVSYASRLAVGEQVAQRLKAKREEEAVDALAPLIALADETVARECPGDRMVFNHSFLVRKEREEAFDAAVAEMTRARTSRLQFKYVLSPPYHFVNLRLHLNEEPCAAH